MATVTGYEAPFMDEIANSTVVDGHVDENGILILETRGGSFINAGNVKGQDGEPGGKGDPGEDGIDQLASAPWSSSQTYEPGNTVGFAGILWKAKQANVSQCPPFYADKWSPITGINLDTWYQIDPMFLANDLSPWEMFWRSAGVTYSLSNAPGSFETGHQGLSISLPASTNQSLHSRDENLVQAGEQVTVEIRAKSTGAAGSTTVSALLFQAKPNGSPIPFGTDSTTVSGGAAIPLTSSWATYTFKMVVAGGGYPRGRAYVTFAQSAAGAATVAVDRIIVTRGPVPPEPEPEPEYQTYTVVITSTGTAPTMGNSTVIGRYRQNGKQVHMSIYIEIGNSGYNVGTGLWGLNVPVPARADIMQLVSMSANLPSPISGDTFGVVKIEGASGILRLHHWDAAVPAGNIGGGGVAPVAGNRIVISGVYEAQ